MLKFHPLCKVCDEIKTKGNKKLLNDIYNTSYFLKGSKTSLRQLAFDYQQYFNYDNLRNHVKKHQFMSEKDFNNRHLREISKKAERQILQKKLDSVEVWNDVIETGMERLKNGEMVVKTGDLLKAAKDKSDFQFKKQDQEFKLAEMIFFFASGENDSNLTKAYDRRIIEGETAEHIDATAELAASVDSGENRPDSVYYPPSWDASPSGTN